MPASFIVHIVDDDEAVRRVVLATLVDVSRLRLRFKVSEAESLRARTAQNVRFHVALPPSAPHADVRRSGLMRPARR